MEAKLAALEEEISILKGEIKAILQEVRTAVLASENPFSGGQVHRAAQSVASGQDAPAGDSKIIQLPGPPSATQPAVDHEAMAEAPTPPIESISPRADSGHAQAEVGAAATSGQAATARSTSDVRALAALLAWVEETRERLDDRRYTIVLGLAAYGGLLDVDLERTLLEAGNTVPGPQDGERSSMNDSIVALRQLEAILTPLPAESIRRLYEAGPIHGTLATEPGKARLQGDDGGRDDDGPYREVRPSRRL